MNQQQKNWGIFFVLLWILGLTIPALTFSQESNQPATTQPGTALAAPAETPAPPAVPSAPSAAAPAPPAKLDKGDNAWMLTSAALVLMMTIPGLFSSTVAWLGEKCPRHHYAEFYHCRPDKYSVGSLGL